MRLDSYMAAEHPEYSRSTWAKYIRAGYVRRGGQVVDSPSTAVTRRDEIDFSVPERSGQPLDLPVIYQDENVIVIDKPAGILTHSKGALNDEFTVADYITTHFADSKDSPWKNRRWGVVHRLDRATSGVMIGAKNLETEKYLKKQFADRRVKKTYRALVDITTRGQKTLADQPAEFLIDLPIGRNPKYPSQFRVDALGKPAQTAVTVLRSDQYHALLELKPTTGRTHQLRVHLAHIGLPIVGDLIYGIAAKPQPSRMLLHAEKLEITLPNGEPKTFQAELPDELK